jgi:hypothetical protein
VLGSLCGPCTAASPTSLENTGLQGKRSRGGDALPPYSISPALGVLPNIIPLVPWACESRGDKATTPCPFGLPNKVGRAAKAGPGLAYILKNTQFGRSRLSEAKQGRKAKGAVQALPLSPALLPLPTLVGKPLPYPLA